MSNSGDVIGEWVIGAELGTGHFAKVKLGTHRDTGKQCAIKIVKKPQGARSARAAQRAGAAAAVAAS